MSRKKSGTNLPPPFLKRISLIADRMAGKKGYPYNLPWLAAPEFEVNSIHECIFGKNENSRNCHGRAIGIDLQDFSEVVYDSET